MNEDSKYVVRVGAVAPQVFLTRNTCLVVQSNVQVMPEFLVQSCTSYSVAVRNQQNFLLLVTG